MTTPSPKLAADSCMHHGEDSRCSTEGTSPVARFATHLWKELHATIGAFAPWTHSRQCVCCSRAIRADHGARSLKRYVCPRCLPTPEVRSRGLPGSKITVTTVLPYSGSIPSIVRTAKYHPHPHLLYALGELMLTSLMTADVPLSAKSIACAPSHPKLLQKRGLNPSRMLAKPIARNLSIPLIEPFRRATTRDPQARLSPAVRRRLPLSTIECAPLEPGPIILLDDVITSGATVSQMADKALTQGATSVTALVLCDAQH